MKRSFRTLLALGLLPPGSCAPIEPDVSSEPDRITQISVINALMVGRYDGVTTIPELLKR